jgi:hypothetical protein
MKIRYILGLVVAPMNIKGRPGFTLTGPLYLSARPRNGRRVTLIASHISVTVAPAGNQIGDVLP